jgi:acyl carrier protein
MLNNEIHSTLKSFIQDDLLQIPDFDFKEDSNLLSLGLDSLKMMRLVVFLETTFKITVNDQDVNAESMSSIQSIHTLINSYLCNTNH